VKTGIVSTMADPVDITLWLQYHVLHLGVDHVFLHLEDGEKTVRQIPKEYF